MIDSLYKDEFLFHFKNQNNNRPLKNKSHVGKDLNASCGDEVVVELNIENEIIKDIGYNSSGCIISTGAMSMLSDFLLGKSIDYAKSLSEDNYIKLLGIDLTYARKKCALVGYKALQNALNK